MCVTVPSRISAGRPGLRWTTGRAVLIYSSRRGEGERRRGWDGIADERREGEGVIEMVMWERSVKRNTVEEGRRRVALNCSPESSRGS